jgi:quercetin dioxygenase-like cupin family protein
MQSWQLTDIDTPGGSRSPVVLHSTDEARAVLIALDPGQELGEHQVHERAWVLVVDGSVRIDADAATVEGGPGFLARFDAGERHAIASKDGARILLLLAPWPGEGHYRSG